MSRHDCSEPIPRPPAGDPSGSRMILGTTPVLGSSPISAARDKYIKETMTGGGMADILEVFLAEGIDTIMGPLQNPLPQEGIKEAEARTGRKLIIVSTPAEI